MEKFVLYGGAESVPHYNCSKNGVDGRYRSMEGDVNIVLGIFIIIYGIFNETIYCIILHVLLKPEFFKLSCYKIMFIIGIFDITAIFILCIFNGFMVIHGATYCSYPNLQYVAGNFSVGAYTGSCISGLFLVLNRVIDLWKENYVKKLFGGARFFKTVAIISCYSGYFIIFSPPCPFNSKYFACFFNPLINGEDSVYFLNYPHIINNIGVVFSTCFLYIALCAVLIHKFAGDQGFKFGRTQKKIIVQSCLICSLNMITAVVYEYFQFLPSSPLVIAMGQVLWILIQGTPSLIYLAFNQTIREHVWRIIKKPQPRKVTTILVSMIKK